MQINCQKVTFISGGMELVYARCVNFEKIYAKIAKRTSSLIFFIYICAPLKGSGTKNTDY